MAALSEKVVRELSNSTTSELSVMKQMEDSMKRAAAALGNLIRTPREEPGARELSVPTDILKQEQVDPKQKFRDRVTEIRRVTGSLQGQEVALAPGKVDLQ